MGLGYAVHWTTVLLACTLHVATQNVKREPTVSHLAAAALQHGPNFVPHFADASKSVTAVKDKK